MIFGTTSRLATFANTGELTHGATANVGPTDTTLDLSARTGTGLNGTEFRQTWMADMRPGATTPVKLIGRSAKEPVAGPPKIPGQFYTAGTNLTGTRAVAAGCQSTYGVVLSANHVFVGNNTGTWSVTAPVFYVQGVSVWDDPADSDGLVLFPCTQRYGSIGVSNYYTQALYSHVQPFSTAMGLSAPVGPYGFAFSIEVATAGSGTITNQAQIYHRFNNIALLAQI